MRERVKVDVYVYFFTIPQAIMSFLRVYRTDVDWNADNGQFTLLQYAAHQVHCRFMHKPNTIKTPTLNVGFLKN